jgi:hypothetical protein
MLTRIEIVKGLNYTEIDGRINDEKQIGLNWLKTPLAGKSWFHCFLCAKAMYHCLSICSPPISKHTFGLGATFVSGAHQHPHSSFTMKTTHAS